jgi:hypothetical protein
VGKDKAHQQYIDFRPPIGEEKSNQLDTELCLPKEEEKELIFCTISSDK